MVLASSSRLTYATSYNYSSTFATESGRRIWGRITILLRSTRRVGQRPRKFVLRPQFRRIVEGVSSIQQQHVLSLSYSEHASGNWASRRTDCPPGVLLFLELLWMTICTSNPLKPMLYTGFQWFSPPILWRQKSSYGDRELSPHIELAPFSMVIDWWKLTIIYLKLMTRWGHSSFMTRWRSIGRP